MQYAIPTTSSAPAPKAAVLATHAPLRSKTQTDIGIASTDHLPEALDRSLARAPAVGRGA